MAATTLVSFAYPQTPEGLRARLVEALDRATPPDDAFLLATCLRVEVMVPGDRQLAESRLVGLFGRIPDGGEWLHDLEAVQHLFRVAAGLASPLRGEPEVLTQVRRALGGLRSSGRFRGLVERAVAAGRLARREYLPEPPRGSLAAVAARLVAPAGKVAILGAGEMAMAAADHLADSGVDVTVVCRRPERVRFRGRLWPFDRAEEALAVFPAVVSATSAKHRLVDGSRLAELLASRSEPLLLVDLAMPPDFVPPPGAPVRYLSIDEIAGMAEATREYEDAAEEAVAAAAEEAWRWYRDVQLAEVISSWYSAADQVVDRTVAKFAGKVNDPRDVELLRRAVHTAARTLLSGPVEWVKNLDGRPVEELAGVFDPDDR